MAHKWLVQSIRRKSLDSGFNSADFWIMSTSVLRCKRSRSRLEDGKGVAGACVPQSRTGCMAEEANRARPVWFTLLNGEQSSMAGRWSSWGLLSPPSPHPSYSCSQKQNPYFALEFSEYFTASLYPGNDLGSDKCNNGLRYHCCLSYDCSIFYSLGCLADINACGVV
jgi:hypothetical protein